ncbi:MAG: YvrJ family protein [Tissierellia bacterium]|nr:YvrJ family protein [Tissierellia bacterium]
MEELFMNIANFGFSIVISIYLLVRMEKKIEDLTKSINELNKTIIKIK